jgi:hypothetical protein
MVVSLLHEKPRIEPHTTNYKHKNRTHDVFHTAPRTKTRNHSEIVTPALRAAFSAFFLNSSVIRM